MLETDPGSLMTNRPFFSDPPFTLHKPVAFETARDTFLHPEPCPLSEEQFKHPIASEHYLLSLGSQNQIELVHQQAGHLERFCIKVLRTLDNVPTRPLTFWSLWHDFRDKVPQAPSQSPEPSETFAYSDFIHERRDLAVALINRVLTGPQVGRMTKAEAKNICLAEIEAAFATFGRNGK